MNDTTSQELHINLDDFCCETIEERDKLRALAQTIWLVRMALHKRVVGQSALELLNLPEIARIAKLHYIEPIVASALPAPKNVTVHLEESYDWALRSLWGAFYKNKRRSILLSLELANISTMLSARGIWHSPIKGMVVKDLYPREDMRTMIDIDMFYDVRMQENLVDVFEKMGYKTVILGGKRHDIFEKEDLYEVEMHRVTFDCWDNTGEYDEYDARHFDEGFLPNKNSKSSSSSTKYTLSCEGHYLYVMDHIHRDFLSAGTGFRSMIDCVMCLQAWGMSMNWDYIADQAIAAKQGSFLAYFQSMSMKVFLVDEDSLNLGVKGVLHDLVSLTAQENKIFWRCIDSGQKGKVETLVDNLMQDSSANAFSKLFSKLNYLRKRVMPGTFELQSFYPRASRYVVIRPALWAHRLVYTSIANPKKHIHELKTLWKK